MLSRIAGNALSFANVLPQIYGNGFYDVKVLAQIAGKTLYCAKVIVRRLGYDKALSEDCQAEIGMTVLIVWGMCGFVVLCCRLGRW